MRTPAKEELNNYIYAIGYEESLKLFHISDKKAENILFGSPQRILDEEDEVYNPEPVVIDLDEVSLLYSCIKINYYDLKKHFAGANDGLTINKHGKNIEDLFHDSLLYIIENCSGITFEGPEQVLFFIKSRLYSRKRTQQKKVQKTEFIQIKEALISCLQDEDIPVNSILSNARIIIDHAIHQSTKKEARAVV